MESVNNNNKKSVLKISFNKRAVSAIFFGQSKRDPQGTLRPLFLGDLRMPQPQEGFWPEAAVGSRGGFCWAALLTSSSYHGVRGCVQGDGHIVDVSGSRLCSPSPVHTSSWVDVYKLISVVTFSGSISGTSGVTRDSLQRKRLGAGVYVLG